jgi:hypothetical protein
MLFALCVWIKIWQEAARTYSSIPPAAVVRTLNAGCGPSVALLLTMLALMAPMAVILGSWFGHRVENLGSFGSALATFVNSMHRALGRKELESMQSASMFMQVDVLVFLGYLVFLRLLFVPVFKAHYYEKYRIVRERLQNRRRKLRKHSLRMYVEALLPEALLRSIVPAAMRRREAKAEMILAEQRGIAEARRKKEKDEAVRFMNEGGTAADDGAARRRKKRRKKRRKMGASSVVEMTASLGAGGQGVASGVRGKKQAVAPRIDVSGPQ